MFCQKLQKHNNQCLQANVPIRSIKQLEIGVPMSDGFDETGLTLQREIIKQLLLHCGSISESIYLTRNTNTKIELDNIAQLKTIFHDKLQHFHLGRGSKFQATIKSKMHMNLKKHDDKVGNLKAITIGSSWWDTSVNVRVLDTLKFFDLFSMRYNIQCYTIEWAAPTDVAKNLIERDCDVKILNKIFFEDYDKHPFLSKIEICLTYDFNHHYKQLFIDRKFDLPYFKTIEINFKGEPLTDALIQPYHKSLTFERQPFRDLQSLFDQTCNQQHAIDKSVIEFEMKDVEQGIESFCIIFQNVLSWLKKKQTMHGRPYHQAVTGCKIVFIL